MLDIIADLWLFILIAIPVTVYTIYKTRIKGAIGEKTVAWRLSRLSKSDYKIINNLVLQRGNRTSQIDHVVISKYGVFVIETKNLQGWILGAEHSEYWTQVIYNHRNQFYNPIRQNKGHIMALRGALSPRYSFETFVPIVVFTNNATIKAYTESEVVYASQIGEVVKGYSEVILSDKETDSIYKQLIEMNVSHLYIRKVHIMSIRQRIAQREELLSQNICPRCGNDLVSREGRFGAFRGCSNYPQRKYTD